MKSIVTLSGVFAGILVGFFGTRIESFNRYPVLVHADETPTPKWTKMEVPLKVGRLESSNWKYVTVQGYWQSTSESKDKQLLSPIAAKISCDGGEKICREVDATVEFGSILSPALLEYEISTWTDTGIVADDTDEGDCGIGHRLAIDFKSNSVTVTDYPKKIATGKLCKAFQEANSYALHGGQVMLYPPARWDPLAKSEGKK
jgi:hypothetical protein